LTGGDPLVRLFPLMLVYATVNYRVFRGKVRQTGEHY
jgi:cytochrome bd-type quinol oxidase subunit 2